MTVETFFTPFKVGLFVIAGVIAIVVMAVTVMKPGTPDDAVHTYAYFNDVTGLAVKSRVMSSGIPVGEITKIGLDGAKARVDFTISRKIDPRQGIESKNGVWRNGVVVTKEQIGFVGDFYIKVTPGVAGPPLENGEQVHNVVEAPQLSAIMEKFNEIATNVNEIVLSLRDVLANDDSKQQMRDIIAHLAQLTKTLRDVADENSSKIDRILDNAEVVSANIKDLTIGGGDSVRHILTDAEVVVSQVRSMITDSSGDLQGGLASLKGSLERLQSTLDSLNYSMQNVQDITDKINEGEGTLGELVNNPTIAEKTESILTTADEYIGRLGRMRTILDLHSEYHVQAERLKTVVGLRLQPARDKYYLLELIDDYRGLKKDSSEITTTDETGKDPVVSRTTVLTEDRFKFSLQFAKTFFFTSWFGLTTRFGIFENTGGVGLNFLFLDNGALAFQTDLFNFTGGKYPHLKTVGSYRFLDLVYIMGGVDDVLNADRRQYMIGLGVRFDDEDLKAVVGTTGVPAIN